MDFKKGGFISKEHLIESLEKELEKCECGTRAFQIILRMRRIKDGE